MNHLSFAVALFFTLLSFGVSAAVPPRVATDITPVHSLASMVMDGVGPVDLVIQPNTSPHHHSLRPSEAQALQEADLVIWMGEDFTPSLANSIASLAPDARSVALLELNETLVRSYREGATFEGHDDHGDHGEHEGHGHHDPHAWLDPENARAWLGVIARELAELDPANADTYRRNAARAQVALAGLQSQLAHGVDALGDLRFIVFHDAYQYFEKRFGLEAQGAIALGDASKPGAARVNRLREVARALAIQCVFTEPQYNSALVRSVFSSTGVVVSPVLDPLGSSLEPGPELYGALLEQIVESLESCNPKVS
ncbi:zinc transport system substrate-binding protein [Marinobacter daqiaonensis]|uniref:High-affinity zinc uptake system protein ZnuA n=1 Tax=Marinobacter daqiaonensis TaxID=650891 RepID=A0A1I6IE56_9GAMM|nr:zinc ABC transporter substrate-binding protein [Marinobacter daqiaonensis]SFR65045.1 zinc transport system substrate-binding protein [Marinobacter daqiaonensis]